VSCSLVPPRAASPIHRRRQQQQQQLDRRLKFVPAHQRRRRKWCALVRGVEGEDRRRGVLGSAMVRREREGFMGSGNLHLII